MWRRGHIFTCSNQYLSQNVITVVAMFAFTASNFNKNMPIPHQHIPIDANWLLIEFVRVKLQGKTLIYYIILYIYSILWRNVRYDAFQALIYSS